MNKLMVMMVALAAVLLLVGCGSQTRYVLDKDGAVIERIEERSFFASENYLAYLDAESQDRATHERLATKTINEMTANFNATVFATNAEKVLAAHILKQDIKEVSTYRGTGREAPRTMADQNWPAWGQVLNPWLLAAVSGGIDYERHDSPGNAIKGDGNVFIYKSGIGTGEGSRAQTYLGDYSPIKASTSGEGAPLSLDASRPYDYFQDNSRTRSEAYIDSPRKSDSSLF